MHPTEQSSYLARSYDFSEANGIKKMSFAKIDQNAGKIKREAAIGPPL
jgi:hypothetical protein